MSLSKLGEIPFVQEVIACTKAISGRIPECDTAIELGGEDAKIIYLSGGIEQRMNTACAGGYRGIHRSDGLSAADGPCGSE
ncbi:hypothetical protein ACFSQ7_47350 [Paenibacillus rhizoplanae]